MSDKRDVKLCPVCGGRGIVRSDFYNRYSSRNSDVTCKSCYGRGIIIV